MKIKKRIKILVLSRLFLEFDILSWCGVLLNVDTFNGLHKRVRFYNFS